MTDVLQAVIERLVSLERRVATLQQLDVPVTGVGARVYNNAALTIPNNSTTVLTFNTERFDTDTIHDTSTNPGRLTCKTAGLYVISGHIQWAPNGTGRRIMFIRFNGANRIARQEYAPSSDESAFSITTDYQLSVDDYVELQVYQNSGGNLDVSATEYMSPEFAMVKVG